MEHREDYMCTPDDENAGFYPGIFVWGQTDKIFYRGGQLFVYWGPIISSVYSICKRKYFEFLSISKAKFFSFYQFPIESFEYLSISKRKFSVFVNFHAKVLNIYQFPREIFQFL